MNAHSRVVCLLVLGLLATPAMGQDGPELFISDYNAVATFFRSDFQQEIGLTDEEAAAMYSLEQSWKEDRLLAIAAFGSVPLELEREILKRQREEVPKLLSAIRNAMPEKYARGIQTLNRVHLRSRLNYAGLSGDPTFLSGRELQSHLSLTDEQRARIDDLADEARQKAKELLSEFNQKLASSWQQRVDKLLKELDGDQRRKYSEIVGENIVVSRLLRDSAEWEQVVSISPELLNRVANSPLQENRESGLTDAIFVRLVALESLNEELEFSPETMKAIRTVGKSSKQPTNTNYYHAHRTIELFRGEKRLPKPLAEDLSDKQTRRLCEVELQVRLGAYGTIGLANSLMTEELELSPTLLRELQEVAKTFDQGDSAIMAEFQKSLREVWSQAGKAMLAELNMEQMQEYFLLVGDIDH